MKKFIILIFIVLASSLISAETRVVTIRDCVNIAMQNNPDFFASQQDYSKSLFMYKIAKAQSGVQVNSGVYTRETIKDATSERIVKIPGKDTDVGLFAGFNAVYSLYDPQKGYREDAARINIDINKLNTIIAKNNIINKVKTAYYDYIISRENTLININRLKQYEFRKKLGDIQYQNGAISIMDYTRIDIELNQMKMELERVKNGENLRLSDLYTSMGIKKSDIFTIEPQQMNAIYDLKFTLDDLYKLSETFNPQIAIAVMNKKISKMSIDSRKALHDPSVNLTLSLGVLNSRIAGMDRVEENYKIKNWEPMFGGVVSAGFPVYTGGSISAQVDIATIDYNKSVFNERNVIISVRNGISTTVQNINDLIKQHDISRLVLEQSEKQFKMTKSNFDSGLANQADLDNGEISLQMTKLNHLSIIINYYKNLSYLSLLVGIDEDNLCKK